MNRFSTKQCVVVSLSGVAMGLAVGCSTEPVALEPLPSALLAKQPAEPVEKPSSQARMLAEQSQRDVEAILKAPPPSAKTQPVRGASATPPATPTTPPVIVWNDAYAMAEKAGTNQIHQPPLGQIPAQPTIPIERPSLAAATPEPVGPPAPEPEPETSAQRVQRLAADLARELYSTGSSSDAPLRELMVVAAMSMIDRGRQLDPQAIPDLTENEREMLGYMQSFFSDLNTGLAQPEDAEAVLAGAATKLHDSLIKQPTLQLPTATLCTRVGGFGDYSTFEKNSFLAGSTQKVIVYLEIDDFTSELNSSDDHVTELSQQLTIYADRDGIPVWKEDWQTAVDRSKNQRQDFFTVQVVTLPKALSVGRYQLKVRARDDKSKAEAEATISFEMVADPRLATK